MKRLILLVFVLCVISCKKDSINIGSKILKVTVNGKIHESFEYDQANRLVRESHYFWCTTNPTDEFIYIYNNDKLEKMSTVYRSLLSSTIGQCDPSKGVPTEDVFIYDSSGRISKIVRPSATTEYVYNPQGFVSKMLYGGGTNKFSEYFYDSRGNVIKQINAEGQVTEYEYDSAPNPFYQHRPNISTPFTMSPNNLIKGKGASNFVRKFEYKSNMPISVLDDNGQTYEYHYQ